MLLFHLPAWVSLLLAPLRPDEPLRPLDIYGTEETAFFSRHRVREIVVLKQGYYKGKLSGPLRALAAQQLDRQGRVIKQWKYPNQGRFSALEESTYDAAGHLTDLTTYDNATPVADTSRLGTSWQPKSRGHYPLKPGQTGYGERWDPQAKRWQRTEATRRWSSHDTTYVQTTRLPDTMGGFLLRTYPTPGGRTRADYLLTGKWFMNDLMTEPQYTYTRQENGREVEFGWMHFEDDLRAYLAQHPQVAKPAEGTEAYSRLLDQVARHAAGRAETLGTNSYDAQGRLLKEAAKYFFTTYQRNDQGRLQTTAYYIQNQLSIPPAQQNHTVLSYLPSGLLARQEITEEINGLADIRYYLYRYY